MPKDLGKPTSRYSLYMPFDLKRQLAITAKEQGTSMNKLIVKGIRVIVAHHKKNKKAK